MPNYQFRVFINTPEGEEHEFKDVIEAASYSEAMLRGYVRAVNATAQFRRDSKLEKMNIELVGHGVTIEIKKVADEE